MEQIREMKVYGRDYEVTTLVDEEDYQRLRLWEYHWHRHVGGKTAYVRTCRKRKTIHLHRLILGLLDAPRSVFVDHIDGDGLNNCKNNLRITDNRGNQRNRRKQLSETSSLYKGVGKHTHNKLKPWEARIYSSGKRKYLGYYQTEMEAAQAYNKAATELFGPMACLNDLSPQDHPDVND